MDENGFLFLLTKPDVDKLLSQTALALETRVQAQARQKSPSLWKWTDRLSARSTVKRRPASRWSGVLCLVLGVFLFVPGLLRPAELTLPLIVGAVGIAAGLCSLLRGRRGAGGSFTRSARQLLEGLKAGAQVRLDESGLYLCPEGMEPVPVPFEKFELAVEAEDIFLLFFLNSVLLLQKKDLSEGDADALRALLAEKTTLLPALEKSAV